MSTLHQSTGQPTLVLGAEDLGGTKSLRATYTYNLVTGEYEKLCQVEVKRQNGWDYTDLSIECEAKMSTPFSKADILVHSVAGLPKGKGKTLEVGLSKFKGGRARLGKACFDPRLDWGVPQFVQNDFVSQGWAVNLPNVRKKRQKIICGNNNWRYNAVMLGPGTGCGVVGLVRTEAKCKKYLPYPSEGGNAPMAIDGVDEKETKFFSWLENEVDEIKKGAPLRIEHVISGRGIERVHKFLHRKELSIAEIEKALNENDSKAVKTADFWAKICGRFARSLALTFLAWGGVFITGGAVQKQPKFINRKAFIDAFRRGPTFPHQKYIDETPVVLLTMREIGLMGALARAIKEAKSLSA